eukprot:306693_1
MSQSSMSTDVWKTGSIWKAQASMVEYAQVEVEYHCYEVNGKKQDLEFEICQMKDKVNSKQYFKLISLAHNGGTKPPLHTLLRDYTKSSKNKLEMTYKLMKHNTLKTRTFKDEQNPSRDKFIYWVSCALMEELYPFLSTSGQGEYNLKSWNKEILSIYRTSIKTDFDILEGSREPEESELSDSYENEDESESEELKININNNQSNTNSNTSNDINYTTNNANKTRKYHISNDSFYRHFNCNPFRPHDLKDGLYSNSDKTKNALSFNELSTLIFDDIIYILRNRIGIK